MTKKSNDFLIPNPDDVYIGPRGLTKREFIILEFAKIYMQECGLEAGLKRAIKCADSLIYHVEDDIEDEEQEDDEDEEY